VFLAPAATHASDWNLMTRFTVNHPFEVPGLTLEPNTRYVIRLHDIAAQRNVVQVLNSDETKMLTEFIALADYRLEPSGKTVFTFIETEPGCPTPIKEWFYPGRLSGLEFVYPKEQALEIARHAREPVLAAESNVHDLSTVTVEAISPLGPEVPPVTAQNLPQTEMPPVEQAKPTPAPEVAPPSPPVAEEQPQQPPEEAPAVAENKPPEVQQPEAAPTPAPETTRRELPKTAGELPLMALIGALCLGAGMGLKVLSARS